MRPCLRRSDPLPIVAGAHGGRIAQPVLGLPLPVSTKKNRHGEPRRGVAIQTVATMSGS